MSSLNSKRVKKRGKGEWIGQFMALPHNLAHSSVFRSLSGNAVKIFIELGSYYNGHNNGDLSLSYSRAAMILGMGKTSVKRAFDELVEKGLLHKTSDGSWYGRKAATWGMTILKLDLPTRELKARNDWKVWTAEKTAA